jgi:phosphoribosylformylglycinamidine cyclo-ligase
MDPFKNAALKISGNHSELIEFPNFYLVDILEAVGSLNKLAEDIYDSTGEDYYYQVGWGNAATILNDLSMLGAKPLTMKFFIAAGSENFYKDQTRWIRLLKGFGDGAKLAGASWNGGETQTLTDIVNPKSIVLAGSATGIIKPKSNLITDKNLESGDRIILLSSSGVHTNGITLIRKVFTKDPKTLIEAIKPKTILYGPLIETLQKQNVTIHFASHITGHGFRKIMRAKLPFTYYLENLPKPQPIFKKIQDKTGMNNAQMYGDYNMGVGFALFVPEKSVKKTLEIAKKMGIKSIDAGYIKRGTRKVIIKPLGIEFNGNTLLIR